MQGSYTGWEIGIFFFLDQYSIMEMGNSWEFDFDHSQPGIGWEFVKEGASCCSNI